MKSTVKVFVIIAIAAVIGFAMMACGETKTSDPTSATFISYDAEGNTYELVITKGPNRAAYTPKSGDKFELTITGPTGTLLGKSTGTVDKVEGKTFTLKKGSDTFTVTIDGDVIASITGTIPLNEGGTKTPPALIPNKPDNGGGSKVETITITDAQVWTMTSEWKDDDTYEYTYNKFTDNVSGLTHLIYYDFQSFMDEDSLVTKTLNDNIKDNPSVNIMNGKLSVNLGTPNDDMLSDIYNPSFTIEPAGAKGMFLMGFADSDLTNYIIQQSGDSYIMYFYSDKDVKINYFYSYKDVKINKTYNYNGRSDIIMHSDIIIDLNLKAGWNTITRVGNPETTEYTYKTEQPTDDYKWLYWERN